MKPFGLALTFFATALSLFAAGQATSRPPNLIVILGDDLGYECIGANGAKSYQTPNLDRLAREGVRFEHCYAQPNCTPTRVQLMTGQSNVRNYVDFGHHFKLYSTGEFFDLDRDPGEKSPLRIATLQDDAAVRAARKLQGALDHFADARPAALNPPRVPGEKNKRGE